MWGVVPCTLTTRVGRLGSLCGRDLVNACLQPIPAHTTAGAPSACTDIPPSSAYTCQDQARFGKCNESFVVQGGYCQKTCNRCSGQGEPLSRLLLSMMLIRDPG